MAVPVPGFRSPLHRERYLHIYDRLRPSFSAPAQDLWLSTSYGRTHVLAFGPQDAPPLLLLHGLTATALMWGNVAADLARLYRCYAIETPGDANLSECERALFRPEHYVAWLQEALDLLHLEKARVAGLSYGGHLAALLALHAPERVERLCLLSPAGVVAPVSPGFVTHLLPGLITRWRPLIRWFVRWLSYRKESVRHPAAEVVVAAFLYYNQPRNLMQPAAFADDELQRITVPTAVVIGAGEVIYKIRPDEALRRVATLLPHVQTRLIPDSGHLMMLDNPDAFRSALMEGLA